MKGTPATRIAILLLLALIAVAGIVLFAWPRIQPEQIATGSPSGTPASGTPAPAASSATPGPAESSKSAAVQPKGAPAAPVKSAVDTLKDLTKEVAPKSDGNADRPPSFDVARIEPNGETVIGGRAAPGAAVELLRGGVTHARTTADAAGDFVLVPKPLPAGSYDLTLRATHKDGKVFTSKDSVAVVLQQDRKEKPVVALAEPDKPSVVLSKPTTDSAPAPSVVIDAVEGEAGGRMYVSGRAPAGTKVNLYLNDAYIASATASGQGRIAFAIRSGIKPGDYRVRLDQVDNSNRVQKRAEVPFTAPATVAAAAPSTTLATSATVTQTQQSDSDTANKETSGDTANKMAAASARPETTSAPQPKPQPAPAPPPPAATQPPPAAPSTSASGTTTAAPPAASGATTAPPPASDKTAPAPPPAERPAASETTPTPRDTASAADRQPPAPPASSSPATSVPAPSQPPAVAARPEPQPRETASPPPPDRQPPSQSVAASEPAAPEQRASADITPPPAPALAAPTVTAAVTAKPATGRDDGSGVVVIPRVETTMVHRGDSLWRISRTTYGHGIRYSVIYNANRDQIRDPDLIYPGQIFVLPKSKQ